MVPEKIIQVNGQPIRIFNPSPADKLSCGYLGPRGTYGEQAARDLLQSQVDYVPISTNTEIIKRLERGETDLGFIPIENSIEGNVTETVKGLIHGGVPNNSNIRILGETILPIRHMLYGTDEAMQKGVLRSHPQALGQCSLWINGNLPDATIVRETSTAEAVRIATEQNELAIGNRLAGELYGAPVLNDDIMDLKSNHTRFWLLGNGETAPTGNDRVTLVYTLKNTAGALVRAFTPFAYRGISINKVDTLPLGTLDEYYFMMSVDGHEADPVVADAISELKTAVWKVKVLGSFQKSQSKIMYDPEAESHGWIDPTVL